MLAEALGQTYRTHAGLAHGSRTLSGSTVPGTIRQEAFDGKTKQGSISAL
jgi:hypothetical protein